MLKENIKREPKFFNTDYNHLKELLGGHVVTKDRALSATYLMELLEKGSPEARVPTTNLDNLKGYADHWDIIARASGFLHDFSND